MDNGIILTTVYGRRVLVHLLNDKIEHIRVIEENDAYPIGTVVIARVKKILPSSNACFVSIGNGIDYFLTIPNNLSNVIFTDGKNHSIIKCEDEIVVQISSEAIKLKQPSVTTTISIAGRFTVLENSNPGISYSKKISTTDRKRIKLPDNLNEYISKYRLVIRTDALSSESNEEIEADLIAQKNVLDEVISQSKHRNDYTVLYKPGDSLRILINEWLKFKPDEFITDEDTYKDLCYEIASKHQNIKTSFYEDDYPLYNLYKLESQIDVITGKKVFLSSGAFLVVEQGETLTAIDVNSAHAIKGNKDAAVKKINFEAADEIAHILKNRNLSGMILIDFINMKNPIDEAELISYMKVLLSNDDVRCSFVDMTGLGLMEITRMRVFKTFIEQWRS